jgi:hypothetical protein
MLPPDLAMTEAPTLETIDAVSVDEAKTGGRRSRGLAIAIGLLVLLLAAASWYAVRLVNQAQPKATPASPRR